MISTKKKSKISLNERIEQFKLLANRPSPYDYVKIIRLNKNIYDGIFKLKMVDLCAGTGAFTYAFESTHLVDVIYANDYIQASKEIYDANFSHHLTLKNICDVNVKKIPKHDILTAGFPCFMEGTQILTINGYKNIEHVNISADLLMTHTGNFRDIINIQKKMYVGQIFNIKLNHNIMSIKCTPEHPFYVRHKMIQYNDTKNTYDMIHTFPEWKCANKLTKDDYCGMVINKENTIPIFTIDNIIIRLDNKYQWFILGYLISLSYINNENFTYANVMNTYWQYLINQFKIYTTPEWVHSAPKEYIQVFLEGYNTLEHTNIPYNMALGLQRLYFKLGKIMSIDTGDQQNKYKIKDEINTTSFISDGYFWCEISNITTYHVTNACVYNFEVECDNSYIVENTIVHNCQPFSIAGKQLGFDDLRSNVFWKILEIIKYHHPMCIVLENVKNLASHNGGDTLKTIINSLEKEKYNIIYKILDTSKITSIPQHRERIYIVGIRDKKIFNMFDLNFCEVKKQQLKDFLQKNVNDKYYYNKKTPIHKMIQDKVNRNDTIYQYRRVYVRENKNNECPTLTSNMGSGGHNCPIILDKHGPRKLTPRECFNFQGFHQNFILPNMSDSKLYMLAGNAVSIPVVKLIANRLVPLIYQYS